MSMEEIAVLWRYQRTMIRQSCAMAAYLIKAFYAGPSQRPFLRLEVLCVGRTLNNIYYL